MVAPQQSNDGALRRPFARFRLLRALSSAALLAAATSGCLVGNPSRASRWNPAAATPHADVTRGVAYGPLRAQRLDLYASTATQRDGRTIVFVHGGAWSGGDRTQVPPLVLDLLGYGWNVVSIDYRLTCAGAGQPLCAAARFLDQIADVKLALRFVKGHASELGIDPSRLIVAGYSAGGQLATIAALSPGSMEPPFEHMDAAVSAATSDVRGYVDFNGPTDMQAVVSSHDQLLGNFLAPSAAALFPSCVIQADRTAICDADEVAKASAATWLDPADPTGYLFAGGGDTLVPPASQAVPFEALATRVSGDAGRVWLDVAEGAGHSGWPDVNYRQLRNWLQRAVL